MGILTFALLVFGLSYLVIIIGRAWGEYHEWKVKEDIRKNCYNPMRRERMECLAKEKEAEGDFESAEWIRKYAKKHYGD